MANDPRPRGALNPDDITPGDQVIQHWGDGRFDEPLTVLSGVVDYTFDVEGNSVTTPALLVRGRDDDHHRSLYFLGLAPDGVEWSGNHLTRR
jgi:hypothetical protein